MALSLLLASAPVLAQEGLRDSMVGEAAAEGRHPQAQLQTYTFKSGDLRMLVEPYVTLDYNDNVNVSHSDPQDDFILKPMLRFVGSYPVTERNLMQFNVGLGYDQYLNHDSYSGFRLESSSEFSFDVYVKDFWMNLHDRMAYIQDPAGESGVANSAVYGGFRNAAGLTTTWDLQGLGLTIGYDHQNYISASSQFSYTDRASELPIARAGVHWSPGFTAGIEGTASFTAYDQPVLNDNTGTSGGVYGDWQPRTYLHFLPRFGYSFYSFDQTSRYVRAVDQDAWYADLTVRHEITRTINYSLSAGHELRLGVQADSIEDWYVRPSATFRIIKDLGFTARLSYENCQQGMSAIAPSPNLITVSEDYDWLGGGFGLDYRLVRWLLVGVDYRFTIRSSSVSDREYSQNLVGLRLTYQVGPSDVNAL